MIEKLARIAQLLGEILGLCEALAKYDATYRGATLSILGVRLGQECELNCTMHHLYYNNPVCRVSGNNIELVVQRDGRASIRRKSGWPGMWRREEVEEVLTALKANEKVLDDVIDYLNREIEWLKTRLAETILLS
jgi:hypothetical protein